MQYTKTIELNLPYEEALPKVKEAFKARGFGTLTEINVQATLKEKLGKDVEPYSILGVCNPGIAHQALEIEPQVGVLLPCTVVVRAGDNGTAIVHAIEPEMIASVADRPELEPLAAEAGRLIRAALEDLSG